MAKKNNGFRIAQFKFNINLRNFFVIFFVFLFLFYAYRSIKNEIKQVAPEKSITTIVKEAKEGKIKKIDLIDNKLLIYYKNDTLSISYKEAGETFIKTLKDAGINPERIDINIKDTQGSTGLANIIGNILPTILMVAFFIFLFRQAKGAQDSVFSFGQNRGKRFSKSMTKTTFNDVAGVDEAKKELVEIVDFLKSPKKFFDIGDLAFFVVTGTLMGDLFWYALGRRIGDHTNADSGISFVARWAEKIAAPLDAHLLDRPRRTIFISKFAYGFHHALLVRLGMLRFPWRKLIKLDFIASVLWIFIVGGLGYFSGAAFFASKRYLRFVEAGVLLSLVFFLAVEHFVIKKWKI